MNQILIIIAIVGIGYLLYRSLVIKRQPNDDNEQTSQQRVENTDADNSSEPPADVTVEQRTTTDTEPMTAEEPQPKDRSQSDVSAAQPQAESDDLPSVDKQTAVSKKDEVVAADAQVGEDAVEEAHQAEAKAVQKAHMQTASAATKSSLEQHAGSGLASDNAPTVPADVKVQAAALGETNDPLARHRLYQQIVEQCYRTRDEKSARLGLLHYAQAHIAEFDDISEPLKKQNGGKLPQVATFKHCAAVLTESGQYDEAIAVCQQALSYGLKDGTKTGYQGRLERIEKLKVKHQS